MLLHGALLASELMQKIDVDLNLRTSAGVGYNKLVAKVACGVGKPAGLTVVSSDGGLSSIAKKIPITSVPGLGGKGGEVLSKTFKTMFDLSCATVDDIVGAGDESISQQQAAVLLRTSQGICSAKVTPTTYFSNITVTKQYREGTTFTIAELQSDLEALADELKVRIEEEMNWNHRRATSVKISIKLEDVATEGFSVTNVASLSPKEIQSEAWKQFGHANDQAFKMNRIELTVKKFDFI